VGGWGNALSSNFEFFFLPIVCSLCKYYKTNYLKNHHHRWIIYTNGLIGLNLNTKQIISFGSFADDTLIFVSSTSNNVVNI